MIRSGPCLLRSTEYWRDLEGKKKSGGGEKGEAGRGHVLKLRHYLLLLMGASPKMELRGETWAEPSPCYKRGHQEQETSVPYCPGKFR